MDRYVIRKRKFLGEDGDDDDAIEKPSKCAKFDDELRTRPIFSYFTFAKRQRASKLLDLPIEMLGKILLHTVVQEVMDLKLAKLVWKSNADVIILRLKEVCTTWSNILTGNWFDLQLQNELCRLPMKSISSCCKTVYDSPGFAGPPGPGDTKPIRSDTVGLVRWKPHLPCAMTKMENQLFVIVGATFTFNLLVYEYQNSNTVKLARQKFLNFVEYPQKLIASHDCLYILDTVTGCVSRISLPNLRVTTWLRGVRGARDISMGTSGDVLIFRHQSILEVYQADGYLKLRLDLSDGHLRMHVNCVTQNSKGNFIFFYETKGKRRGLREIGADGQLVRQRECSKEAKCPVVDTMFVDSHDRLIGVNFATKNFNFFDSQLNWYSFHAAEFPSTAADCDVVCHDKHDNSFLFASETLAVVELIGF